MKTFLTLRGTMMVNIQLDVENHTKSLQFNLLDDDELFELVAPNGEIQNALMDEVETRILQCIRSEIKHVRERARHDNLTAEALEEYLSINRVTDND